MRNITLIVPLLLCAMSGYGQVLTSPVSSSTVTLGSGSFTQTVPFTTIGNCITSNGMLVDCGGGRSSNVPVENRKDNGRGPTIQLIRASARHLGKQDLASTAYVTLAKSLGMSTDEADLLDAIHQADLTVYDFDKVDNYLYRQALHMKSDTRWVWKPLRDADLKGAKEPTSEWGWSQPETVGFYFPKVYSRRVPIKALSDVRSILANIPEAVFLVSDFEVVKPDPFLAVTTPRLLSAGKIWIIEQWDEPGFGEPVNETRTQISLLQ